MLSTASTTNSPLSLSLSKRRQTHLHKLIVLSSSSLNFTMSAIEMSSFPNLSYQKLKNEGWLDHDDHHEEREKAGFGRSKSWSRLRKVPTRKRFKLRIPSLRKFLRRKARLVSSFRVSWSKIMKRLRESQSHFGDLFAGNYMFLQVNPTQFKCIEKSLKQSQSHHDHQLHGLASRYSLPKVY